MLQLELQSWHVYLTFLRRHETLQFYLGDIAEPFEGIDLIIVSIFETKGLALLATSFGNYALEDSLFTLLIMCHMCCGAFAFLMVSCQRTKTIKRDFGALFTFRIS